MFYIKLCTLIYWYYTCWQILLVLRKTLSTNTHVLNLWCKCLLQRDINNKPSKCILHFHGCLYNIRGSDVNQETSNGIRSINVQTTFPQLIAHMKKSLIIWKHWIALNKYSFEEVVSDYNPAPPSPLNNRTTHPIFLR